MLGVVALGQVCLGALARRTSIWNLGAGLHPVLHNNIFKVGVKVFTIHVPQVFGIVGCIITPDSYRMKQLIHNETKERFGAGLARRDCRFCFLDECFAFLLENLEKRLSYAAFDRASSSQLT